MATTQNTSIITYSSLCFVSILLSICFLFYSSTAAFTFKSTELRVVSSSHTSSLYIHLAFLSVHLLCAFFFWVSSSPTHTRGGQIRELCHFPTHPPSLKGLMVAGFVLALYSGCQADSSRDAASIHTISLLRDPSGVATYVRKLASRLGARSSWAYVQIRLMHSVEKNPGPTNAWTGVVSPTVFSNFFPNGTMIAAALWPDLVRGVYLQMVDKDPKFTLEGKEVIVPTDFNNPYKDPAYINALDQILTFARNPIANTPGGFAVTPIPLPIKGSVKMIIKFSDRVVENILTPEVISRFVGDPSSPATTPPSIPVTPATQTPQNPALSAPPLKPKTEPLTIPSPPPLSPRPGPPKPDITHPVPADQTLRAASLSRFNEMKSHTATAVVCFVSCIVYRNDMGKLVSISGVKRSAVDAYYGLPDESEFVAQKIGKPETTLRSQTPPGRTSANGQKTHLTTPAKTQEEKEQQKNSAVTRILAKYDLSSYCALCEVTKWVALFQPHRKFVSAMLEKAQLLPNNFPDVKGTLVPLPIAALWHYAQIPSFTPDLQDLLPSLRKLPNLSATVHAVATLNPELLEGEATYSKYLQLSKNKSMHIINGNVVESQSMSSTLNNWQSIAAVFSGRYVGSARFATSYLGSFGTNDNFATTPAISPAYPSLARTSTTFTLGWGNAIRAHRRCQAPAFTWVPATGSTAIGNVGDILSSARTVSTTLNGNLPVSMSPWVATLATAVTAAEAVGTRSTASTKYGFYTTETVDVYNRMSPDPSVTHSMDPIVLKLNLMMLNAVQLLGPSNAAFQTQTTALDPRSQLTNYLRVNIGLASPLRPAFMNPINAAQADTLPYSGNQSRFAIWDSSDSATQSAIATTVWYPRSMYASAGNSDLASTFFAMFLALLIDWPSYLPSADLSVDTEGLQANPLTYYSAALLVHVPGLPGDINVILPHKQGVSPGTSIASTNSNLEFRPTSGPDDPFTLPGIQLDGSFPGTAIFSSTARFIRSWTNSFTPQAISRFTELLAADLPIAQSLPYGFELMCSATHRFLLPIYTGLESANLDNNAGAWATVYANNTTCVRASNAQGVTTNAPLAGTTFWTRGMPVQTHAIGYLNLDVVNAYVAGVFSPDRADLPSPFVHTDLFLARSVITATHLAATHTVYRAIVQLTPTVHDNADAATSVFEPLLLTYRALYRRDASNSVDIEVADEARCVIAGARPSAAGDRTIFDTFVSPFNVQAAPLYLASNGAGMSGFYNPIVPDVWLLKTLAYIPSAYSPFPWELDNQPAFICPSDTSYQNFRSLAGATVLTLPFAVAPPGHRHKTSAEKYFSDIDAWNSRLSFMYANNFAQSSFFDCADQQDYQAVARRLYAIFTFPCQGGTANALSEPTALGVLDNSSTIMAPLIGVYGQVLAPASTINNLTSLVRDEAQIPPVTAMLRIARSNINSVGRGVVPHSLTRAWGSASPPDPGRSQPNRTTNQPDVNLADLKATE